MCTLLRYGRVCQVRATRGMRLGYRADSMSLGAALLISLPQKEAYGGPGTDERQQGLPTFSVNGTLGGGKL